MRLAFVDIEDPEDVTKWSGIPYFILQELRRQNIEVEVIAPLKRPFKYLFAPYKIVSKFKHSGIQINRRGIALRSFARQVERRISGKRFDAIFSTSSIPIARLEPSIPVLYWTDAVIDGMADYYGGPFANITPRELCISRAQEQAALDRASYAIYGSSWAAQSVNRLYKVSSDKVKVIQFGANLSVSNDHNDIERYNERRLNSQCILLFIGVDWDRKGGPCAFETAKLLNDRGIKTVLKIVGCDGPEAPFVEKLGFVNKNTSEGQEKIKQLLATSTFFILPTRAEAAGIVFCEASAYGLPALTTKTGGVESYVIDSQTGYCLPLTADAIAYADLITSALSSPDTYRRLSLGAFERYKRTLNWNVSVSCMLKLADQAQRELHEFSQRPETRP